MAKQKIDRKDVYDRVTEIFVEALEQAAQPMEWPWIKSAQNGAPVNFVSKREYSGINRLILGLAGGSKFWGTFKQWKDAGAQVRKGEKGTPVIYYGDLYVDPETGARVDPETPGAKKIIYAKGATVFNAHQVDGWTAPETAQVEAVSVEGAGRFELIEEFVSATGATVYEQGEVACYRPGIDQIFMPTRNLFRDTKAADATTHFYSTLLHELTHWTGHHSRCDRDLASSSRADYAFEELVAEIGAAFLSADLNLSPLPREDNISYVQSWIKALKNDPKKIVEAARLAGRASEFLHDLQSVEFVERMAEAA